MSKILKLNRGLDLRLNGDVRPETAVETSPPKIAAIYPDDFPGFIPKPGVHEGDAVAAGAELMHDKINEEIRLVSPIDGRVKSIVRGERRKIIRIEVEAAAVETPRPTFDLPKSASADDLKHALMQSGLWAMMRQRPYDVVPAPAATPVNIFVTAFDSAPLAPSLTAAVAGKQRELAAGVALLAKLTSGEVFVSTRNDADFECPSEAHHIIIEGPHPAGNAGVQADNIAPVNKGETIWTLDIVTLARIGELVLTGKVDWTTTVAVTGSDVETPKMITTTIGAAIEPLLRGNLKESGKHHRVITGNVLTGVKTDTDGYIRFPYRQITVIPEGDDVDEFMGWASMSPKKMSVSRSFLSGLLRGGKYSPDARLNGGRRAMIMSEQYDKVMPMDILPEYLVKAILARDIDQMERLGIYEVAPEDFALCEYVDPSKLELQKIVREGLDYLRKELE